MTRKVIPAETPAAVGAQGGAALNEYEEARAARIARNNEMLAALGVPDAVARVATQGITTWRRTKPQSSSAAGHKRSLTESRTASAPAPEDLAPVRVSKRQRLRKGLPVDDLPEGGARSGAPGDAPPGTPELEGEYSRLLTVDEYLDRKGLPKGPMMTGHFTGWVEESVRQKLGLATSAAEAWESNGGGQFSRRCPKGESAKEFARSMLHKNPNAYFYRHNVPGEDTWHGEWAAEELERFVEARVATTHGCGDKWGLFASYIPHRVGYQCSAAYRHILIPRGLLRDDHFRMTHSGEAIWVAAKGGRSKEDD